MLPNMLGASAYGALQGWEFNEKTHLLKYRFKKIVGGCRLHVLTCTGTIRSGAS